ncbi:phosphoenolpyruvate--protein phosphotransferase [Kribbella sp. NPDC050820]|uniref:phosphoenolpyruvate--protein phosphotransferase n=1 Tax=Kribbella sp. NPDC050820 TaxID=3155408 RepID=UPI0033F22821
MTSDQTIEVAVSNEHGLHARPAARLVALVNSYDATVTLTDLDTGRGPVDAVSLSMVATLNAQQGHRLQVGATGPQATEALAAIAELAEQDFGDTPTGGFERAGGPGVGGAGGEGSGGPAAAGGSGLDVAIGPAVVVDAQVDLSDYSPGDDEHGRLADALDAAGGQLERLRDGSSEHGGIFDAQLAMLRDRKPLGDVRAAISAGESAADAWKQVYDKLARVFEGLDDAYQRERAQDVRSVRDRVLRVLTGDVAERPEEGILVVPELDAATAATVDAERIAGIAVRAAGTTGHGVIVARSRGIPLITGIGDVAVQAGAIVAFDARHGSFQVAPDEATIHATIVERRAEREHAAAQADQPATTVDGRTIDVLVNVGSVQDAVDARGADGSGLVRTEVLFGDRRTPPTVEEQVETFRAVAAALDGKPITIRTWDIGGDKPLPFLPQDHEANPFLGERGLRVFRSRPQLLRDQLEAIRQVAAETPVLVMFPMVTTADEVAWALDELGPRPDGLEVGIMVEVPAAALRIETLAKGLDFVSIGTNDLTQYTTAADRTNSAVAPLADGLDPAVLQLIDHVVRHSGVRVAVCGDLASDPSAAVLLAALGVQELSAVGPQVPLVKARLRETDLTQLPTAEILGARDAAQVRGLL